MEVKRFFANMFSYFNLRITFSRETANNNNNKNKRSLSYCSHSQSGGIVAIFFVNIYKEFIKNLLC